MPTPGRGPSRVAPALRDQGHGHASRPLVPVVLRAHARRGDGIQAKNTQRLVIEANEIFGVSRPDGSKAHPDAIQSIYGALDLVIRDNLIHDIGAQGVFIESSAARIATFAPRAT